MTPGFNMTDDADLPPLVQPVDVPRAEAKPPAPAFWESVIWCVLMLVALYGTLIVAAGVVWVGEGAATGDVEAFMKKEQAALDAAAQDGKNQLPPGLSNALAWGMLAGQLGALVFVLLVIRVRVGKGWTKRLAIRRPALSLLLLAFLATPGLMILHGGVHELVHAAFGVQADNSTGEMLKSMFAGWPAAFAVIVIGICPGLLEEVFCRGFLGRGLVAKYGFVFGVGLTSILFGLLHVLPLYALGTMFMGATLHFTYITTRSLWVPILIHAFNNGITILATLGTIRLAAAEQEAATLDVWIYVASVVSVVGLFAALWTGREKWESEEPPQYPTLETPPSGSMGELRRESPNPIAAAIGVLATGVLLYLVFK